VKRGKQVFMSLGCALALLSMPALAQAQQAAPVQAPVGPLPAPVQAPVGSAGVPSLSLVIGVGHDDPANQANMDDTHRLFDYTDFFSRSVTVHSGDTLDFRWSAGSTHVVALAGDEAAARKAYPVGNLDTEDANLAPGSGGAKITLGPGQQSITGGSTGGGGQIGRPESPPPCGLPSAGQVPCIFKGGNDVEATGIVAALDPQSGQPTPLDWKVTINAAPGSYAYFCYIHPGMRGTLTVAPADQPISTQAQVDAASAAQFADDQSKALAVEQAANSVVFSGGAPGTRVYQVLVGLAAADNHVAIDEILPNKPLSLVPGDQVQYVWKDSHEVHTVTFPNDMAKVPNFPGFDCGTTFQPVPEGAPPPGAAPFVPCADPTEKAPEPIFDPGNAASGTALSDPSAVVDSGIFIGADYGLTPPATSWSVKVTGSTKPGSYQWMCTVHDWMQGTITVGG